MAAHTTQLPGFRKTDDTASLLFLLLSCAAHALLLAVVYDRWARVRTATGGLLLGALMGTLIACMTDLYWYSTSTFFNSLLPVVADIAAAAVTVGIMGAAIGGYLGWARRRA